MISANSKNYKTTTKSKSYQNYKTTPKEVGYKFENLSSNYKLETAKPEFKLLFTILIINIISRFIRGLFPHMPIRYILF